MRQFARPSIALHRGILHAIAVIVMSVTATLRPVSAHAQILPRLPPLGRGGSYADTTRRSGPRFGVAWLGGSFVDSIRVHMNRSINPMISLFGWQAEYSFPHNATGIQPLSDVVMMVGGLEQGVFLPSVSWIVGARMPNDVEFGVGPNVSAAGAGLVLTVGITQRMGVLNVPFNVAVVPSALGTRVSVTTGFNAR